MTLKGKKLPGGIKGNEEFYVVGIDGNTYVVSLTDVQESVPVSEVTEILDIPTTELDTDLVLKPDGAGGVSWETPSVSEGSPGGSSGAIQINNSDDFGDLTDFNSDYEFYWNNSDGLVIGDYNSNSENYIQYLPGDGGFFELINTSLAGEELSIAFNQSGLNAYWNGETNIVSINLDNVTPNQTFLVSDGTNENILQLIPTGILISNIKSGTNQVNAGAAAGELWVDTSAGNTIKIGV